MTPVDAVNILRNAIEQKDSKIVELETALAAAIKHSEALERNETHWITQLDETRIALARMMDERDKANDRLAQQVVDHKIKLDIVEETLADHKTVLQRLVDQIHSGSIIMSTINTNIESRCARAVYDQAVAILAVTVTRSEVL